MASLERIKGGRSGLKPSQAQFWETWDSFWHKETKISQSIIQNLEDFLAAINSGEKRLTYTPNENTSEAQFDELIRMDVDGITVFTDGFEFDSSTGTLTWDFEADVKHLIFYSKQ